MGGSDDNPDPRLAKNKLAVLTGVISRFEQMCGAFSPWPSQEVGDEPNLPPSTLSMHGWLASFLGSFQSFLEKRAVGQKEGRTTTQLPLLLPNFLRLRIKIAP